LGQKNCETSGEAVNCYKVETKKRIYMTNVTEYDPVGRIVTVY